MQQIFPRPNKIYWILIRYLNTSEKIQLSLKPISSLSQIYPPQPQIPTAYPLMQMQECVVFALSRPTKIRVMARFKHHAAIITSQVPDFSSVPSERNSDAMQDCLDTKAGA